MNRLITFFTERAFFSYLILALIILAGLRYAPFEWKPNWIPSEPIAVDAIPDLGENQQIIYTEWPGRSPQDVDDQLTYPLSSRLLGIAGVKSIRSTSVFGLSTIYLIFEEDVDYYWSRSRIIEKLSSLPSGTLPEGTQPALGPDATGLGQVFWYTLESLDQEGKPHSAWSLDSLRSVQDYFVKDALSAIPGVAEVASIGGFVREYHIQLKPDKLQSYNIGLNEVVEAVRKANVDAGARTLEINKAEYLIRGLGAIRNPDDIGLAVIRVNDLEPIRIQDVAVIQSAPAERRGILDKNGVEAVGGVVVARFDANPAEVIQSVKNRIREIEGALPKKTLENGRRVQMNIVPFYDRSILINQTINTLEHALSLEMLITFIVILLLLRRVSVSISVSLTLPIAVLMVFSMMKIFNITANVVALSGIAIAIGTMVDLGIIMSESIEQEFERRKNSSKRSLLLQTQIVIDAAKAVAPAILTAVSTTIISFLPVFALEAAEGKLFHPLAYTKSFSLFAALLVSLFFTPLISLSIKKFSFGFASTHFASTHKVFSFLKSKSSWIEWFIIFAALLLLSFFWNPLEPNASVFVRLLAISIPILGLYYIFDLYRRFYPIVLKKALSHKSIVFTVFGLLITSALCIWLGFAGLFKPVQKTTALFGLQIENVAWWQKLDDQFPGIQKEFMPALDEGEFLLMPTSMPHAGVEQNYAVLRLLDQAVEAIPEVEYSVGKMGRVESVLDPAPIGMYENLIRYKSEYRQNEEGEWIRQWRDHIQSPDDIWEEIAAATQIPGVTGAPKLQPIETRLVMLQTGMRAPMGIKIQASNLASLEAFGQALEPILKEVEGVKDAAVFAERTIGKPYIELEIRRDQIARHGLSVLDVQMAIEIAIGGKPISYSLEDRARYAIRVRYPRELRDSPKELENILVKSPQGYQLSLGELVDLRYTKGPQMIRREDTFITAYVLFDKLEGYSSGTVVENAQKYLNEAIQSGRLSQPDGLTYRFAGSWEQQKRAEARLRLIVPLVLLCVLGILYLQFQKLRYALVIFAGIALAFCGGFIMISFINAGYLKIIPLEQVNLSVAIWVGFIALFGIATDDGVIMGSYIKEKLQAASLKNTDSIHRAIILGARRRLRPAIMTTLTTLLALLPVLSSTGRGSDIMIPMAIPAFGGMLIASLSWILTPVCYAWLEERRLKNEFQKEPSSSKSILLVLPFFLFLLPQSVIAQEIPDRILLQLLKNHPQIERQNSLIDAARSGEKTSGFWREPNLQFGVGVIPIETRLGSQQFRMGIQQPIPKIGSLAIQKNLARTEREVVEWQRVEEALQIESQIKEWLIEWDYSHKKLKILDSLKSILNQAYLIQKEELEQDILPLEALLETTIKENELVKQAKILKEEINQIEIQFMIYTGLKLEPLYKQLSTSQNSSLVDTSLTFSELDFSTNPKLKQLAKKQESASLKTDQARLLFKPSLQLGADFWSISPRTDASPSNNGRNVFSPTLGVQIPLFRSKYKNMVMQSEQLKDALEAQEKDYIQQLALQAQQLRTRRNKLDIEWTYLQKEREDLQLLIKLTLQRVETNERNTLDKLKLQQRLLTNRLYETEIKGQISLIENAFAYLNSTQLTQIERVLHRISNKDSISN